MARSGYNLGFDLKTAMLQWKTAIYGKLRWKWVVKDSVPLTWFTICDQNMKSWTWLAWTRHGTGTKTKKRKKESLTTRRATDGQGITNPVTDYIMRVTAPTRAFEKDGLHHLLNTCSAPTEHCQTKNISVCSNRNLHVSRLWWEKAKIL